MDPWLFLIQFGFYQQNKKIIKLVFLKKKIKTGSVRLF